MTEAPKLYCSFCGKRNDEVPILIAGPALAFICNECVDLCQDIIADQKAMTRLNCSAGHQFSPTTHRCVLCDVPKQLVEDHEASDRCPAPSAGGSTVADSDGDDGA